MVTFAGRFVLVFVVALAIAATVADAETPRRFRNCQSVNKVYAHGIAKNFRVVKTADGRTGRPFVSTKLYLAQPRTLDRDKDGVACEK